MGRKKQQQDNYWDEDFEEDMEALQREADAAEGANSTTEKESGEDVADESGGVIAEEDNIVVIEDVEDGKYSTDEEDEEDENETEHVLADYSEEELSHVLERVIQMLRVRKEKGTLPMTKSTFVQVVEKVCHAPRRVPMKHCIDALVDAKVIQIDAPTNTKEVTNLPVSYSEDPPKALLRRLKYQPHDAAIVGAKFVEAYLTEKKVDKVLIDAKTMKEMEAKLRPPDTTQLFKAVAPLASIETKVPPGHVLQELIDQNYIGIEEDDKSIGGRKRGNRGPKTIGGFRLKYNETKLFKDRSKGNMSWSSLILLILLTMIVAAGVFERLM